MKREEIKVKVLDSISEICKIPSYEIEEESLLENDLGMDSLDTLELIMNLEKELHISIPDDTELNDLSTWSVHQLITYLETKVA